MSSLTTVRGLDGKTFTLRHAPDASLAELKQLIAEQTGIDPTQQHVTRCGRTAVDDDSVAGRALSKAERRAEDEHAGALQQRYSRRCVEPLAEREALWSCSCTRPCGLRNIGGTSCYLNAALQTLLAVEQLAQPNFYTSLLQRCKPTGSSRDNRQQTRRSRLASAIAAFVTEVSGKQVARNTESRSCAPEYLHALLSDGVTGISGAEAFRDGAPADCAECWDLLVRALDISATGAHVFACSDGNPATRSAGSVRQLFCGAWSPAAGVGQHRHSEEAERDFWSLTLLRAGSIYCCFAANGIFPVSTRAHDGISRAKRAKHTPSGHWPCEKASTDTNYAGPERREANCHIQILPEYLVLQFKSDPTRRRQKPVTFPIEGLDLSGYCAPRPAKKMQSGNAAQTKPIDEQVPTVPAVYDLVAAVYYHSSQGPMQAIDGKPLSGSKGYESAKQKLPRHTRGNVVEGKPSAWCNRQAGHYTAAVFRSTRAARCRTHPDADEFLSAGRNRDIEQDRSGSWWVCDDEQVRLLADPKRLIASEVQILMYRRRSHIGQRGKPCTATAQASSSREDSYYGKPGRQDVSFTRTRVLFGEDGNVASTVLRFNPNGVDENTLLDCHWDQYLTLAPVSRAPRDHRAAFGADHSSPL